MKPSFSVIMTSYNCDRFVGQAIESVLAQTCPDWELLVVDDGSSDNSWDVITRYQDPRIRTARFPDNRGACVAYNTAYSLATGEMVASLDCDDVFHPDKLRRQVALLDEEPDVDICGTFIDEIDQSGAAIAQELGSFAPWFNVACDLNDVSSWICQNRLCHSSVVVRKALHDRVGLFDESLIYTPDWTFWIRAFMAGARFSVIPEPLTGYRNRGNNLTNQNRAETRREYATFSGDFFHPYLQHSHRDDLMVKNVVALIQLAHSAGDSAKDAALLLRSLLQSSQPLTGAQTPLHGESRDELITEVIFALQTYIGQLEEAVHWNDEQRQRWQLVATEQERTIANLRKAGTGKLRWMRRMTGFAHWLPVPPFCGLL